MEELQVLSRFFGLVSTGSSSAVDMDFPCDKDRELIYLHKIRGAISAPRDSSSSVFWYFGFTRDPQSYPTSIVDFWIDSGTFGLLQEAFDGTLTGGAGGHQQQAQWQETELDIVVPPKLLGVFFNTLGDSRRFKLECYYKRVSAPKWEIMACWAQYNRRGGG